jgi:ribosomal protein S18 acetylase RimI-like enzyme
MNESRQASEQNNAAHGARLYPRREAVMSESPAPLVVRAALVADAPSIAAIGSVAFPAVHNDVVGAEFAAAVVEQTYSLEALTACIERCTAADDAEFLVAERDGEVIGYLHYDSAGAEPELHRIYVDPDKKRGGVGRALMQELHARLEPGAQYILLVAEANTDAQAFDERQGVWSSRTASTAPSTTAPWPSRPTHRHHQRRRSSCAT